MNILESVEELDKYDLNTSEFSFENEIHLAKVVSCYDGDTMHCIFKHDGKYQKFDIRMFGYDSPEMKPSKKLSNRDQIKEKGELAKQRLEELILNKYVYLYCGKFDKYGRILGVVKLSLDSEKTINDIMVEEGHGYTYFGGTKEV